MNPSRTSQKNPPSTPTSHKANPPVTSADRNREGQFKDTTTGADLGEQRGGADSGSRTSEGKQPL